MGRIFEGFGDVKSEKKQRLYGGMFIFSLHMNLCLYICMVFGGKGVSDVSETGRLNGSKDISLFRPHLDITVSL